MPTKDIEDKILLLREQGSTIEEIAEFLHISSTTIHRIAVKYNINYRVDGISEDMGRQIIQLTRDGYYAYEIAQKIHMSQTAITRFLKKNHYVKIGRSYSTGLNLDQENKIRQLINLGYGRARIAKDLDISESIIRTFCRNLNIKNKNNNFASKITPEIGEQILILQKQGFNSVQIAEVFDINRNNITKFTRKNGAPFKRTKELTEDQKIELAQCKRLRKNFSKAIHRVLHERENTNKYHSLSDYLPYTVKELKEHIESQFESWMTWDNWGVYSPDAWLNNDASTWTWHIDHIKPISKFIYTSMNDAQFKECWALENLRPLSAKQNVHDGATKVRHIDT